jgi:nicotinamide-nucleotide amidase
MTESMQEKPDSTLPRIAAVLVRRRWLLGCAESLTGGGVAAACTGLAGSSDWFWGGIVAYSLAAKQSLLDVPAALLERHGPVSEPVAKAMARGLLDRTGVDVAVATTGIAGPGGGEVLRPVGTVWFAWQLRPAAGGTAPGEPLQHTAVQQFAGDRERVRRRAVAYALDGLCRLLEAQGPKASS